MILILCLMSYDPYHTEFLLSGLNTEAESGEGVWSLKDEL